MIGLEHMVGLPNQYQCRVRREPAGVARGARFAGAAPEKSNSVRRVLSSRPEFRALLPQRLQLNVHEPKDLVRACSLIDPTLDGSGDILARDLLGALSNGVFRGAARLAALLSAGCREHGTGQQQVQNEERTQQAGNTALRSQALRQWYTRRHLPNANNLLAGAHRENREKSPPFPPVSQFGEACVT